MISNYGGCDAISNILVAVSRSLVPMRSPVAAALANTHARLLLPDRSIRGNPSGRDHSNANRGLDLCGSNHADPVLA